MITNIELTGVNLPLSAALKKYAYKKVGRLERFIPRHLRKNLHAEVKIKEINEPHGNKYLTEILLHAPGRQFAAKDSAANQFATIDIVGAKLTAQLEKYKSEHIRHIGARGILARFKRSYDRE